MSKRKSKSKKKGGHGFGPASLNGQKKRKSKRKKKSRFLSFLSNAWPALALASFFVFSGYYCGIENVWERRINSSDYTYDQALQELTLVESERIYGSNDSFECIWDDGEMWLKLGFDAHGFLISSEVRFYRPQTIHGC